MKLIRKLVEKGYTNEKYNVGLELTVSREFIAGLKKQKAEEIEKKVQESFPR